MGGPEELHAVAVRRLQLDRVRLLEASSQPEHLTEKMSCVAGVTDCDPEPGHPADRHGHASAPGSSSSDPIRIASGGGSCTYPQGPRLMWTAFSPAASAGSMSLWTRSPT